MSASAVAPFPAAKPLATRARTATLPLLDAECIPSAPALASAAQPSASFPAVAVAPASVDGPYLEVAYCYEDTVEGLLSAIFAAYARHESPTDLAPAGRLQVRLGQQAVAIETSIEHAMRVRRGVCRAGGEAAFDAVRSAALSDDPHAGTIAYRFVRHVMAANKPHDCGTCRRQGSCGGVCTRSRRSVLSDLAHPAVEPMVRLSRAVGNERHRMMQFLRFEHLEGGVWFARCSPTASVVPLLMDWFVGRFNTQPFVIYDDVHGMAGVYEGREWYLIRTDQLNLPGRAAEEHAVQQAWKRFYDTVAVESRYNPELRRQFMPKRFWKNITEMQETVPPATPFFPTILRP